MTLESNKSKAANRSVSRGLMSRIQGWYDYVYKIRIILCDAFNILSHKVYIINQTSNDNLIGNFLTSGYVINLNVSTSQSSFCVLIDVCHWSCVHYTAHTNAIYHILSLALFSCTLLAKYTHIHSLSQLLCFIFILKYIYLRRSSEWCGHLLL